MARAQVSFCPHPHRVHSGTLEELTDSVGKVTGMLFFAGFSGGLGPPRIPGKPVSPDAHFKPHMYIPGSGTSASDTVLVTYDTTAHAQAYWEGERLC